MHLGGERQIQVWRQELLGMVCSSSGFLVMVPWGILVISATVLETRLANLGNRLVRLPEPNRFGRSIFTPGAEDQQPRYSPNTLTIFRLHQSQQTFADHRPETRVLWSKPQPPGPRACDQDPSTLQLWPGMPWRGSRLADAMPGTRRDGS